MKEIGSCSEFESNIEKILNEVIFQDETYTVFHNGKPVAIILPYWMYEYLQEEVGAN